jgi:hypothetical protein
MSPHLQKRRGQLRQLYGFDFPEDFFRFWEFATRLRPLEPLEALADATHISLVGPFEVLAGRFDGRSPPHSQLLHWRYSMDPPEFFTVLAGGTDGLHWGYYLDDPAAGEGCVASYYANDAFELSADGDNLFEAVRLHVEQHYRDCEDYRLEDPAYAEDYDDTMQALDVIRVAIQQYATADRSETGAEYEELYPPRVARSARVVAATREGMGIVVPPELYRPLPVKDQKLWSLLRKEEGPAEVVEAARRALREGFPGTALKLGKDLWSFGDKRRAEYAYELLDAAYAALGREALRRVLQVHRANRELPSVDILEAEADEGGGAPPGYFTPSGN